MSDPNPFATAAETAVKTAVAEAPTAVAIGALAATASGNPQIASALEMAPTVINLYQNGLSLAHAGLMTQSQLAELFGTVGPALMAAHAKYEAWQAAHPQS